VIAESTMRRLAFIRYLYGVAVDQSRLPEPMCAASVLTFHDAIEQFLILACEHKNLPVKTSVDFMGYWEFLSPKLQPDGLTQKPAMTRLDKARGNLKHRGIRPSREDMQTFYSAAMLFFEENTPTVFGVEFGDVSMVYLVNPPAVRADLEEAEELRKQGDLVDAVGKVAIAFDRLLKSYQERDPLLSGLRWPRMSPTPTGYKAGGPPLNFRPKRGEADKDGYARKKIGEILEQTDALKRAVEPMRDAIVALALGVDYERYRRFLKLTPEVGMRSLEGDIRYAPVPTALWHGKPRNASPDIYRFCFDFVIEVAIRAQAA
jgi:hypothetical protein